jgi:hypothetical protein
MKAIATIVLSLLFAALIVEPGAAKPSTHDGLQAMAQGKPHRARTRVYVRPLYPYRRYHALYPPPYDIEYPGPNAYRQCSGGFATEYRASGPVITPRLHCWWVRG